MKIFKNIYIYVVTLTALITMLVASALILVNLVSLAYTFSGPSYEYDTYYTFENYVSEIRKECNNLLAGGNSADGAGAWARLSVDECHLVIKDREAARSWYDAAVTEMSQKSKKEELQSEFNAIMRTIPWLIVSIPVFVLFNRMRKKQESYIS